jgi:hypothetical protein
VARPERLELPTLWFGAVQTTCQILPEEWLIERIQQVGANSRKLLSPPLVVIYRGIAVVFRALRDLFVTDRLLSRRLDWIVSGSLTSQIGTWRPVGRVAAILLMIVLILLLAKKIGYR